MSFAARIVDLRARGSLVFGWQPTSVAACRARDGNPPLPTMLRTRPEVVTEPVLETPFAMQLGWLDGSTGITDNTATIGKPGGRAQFEFDHMNEPGTNPYFGLGDTMSIQFAHRVDERWIRLASMVAQPGGIKILMIDYKNISPYSNPETCGASEIVLTSTSQLFASKYTVAQRERWAFPGLYHSCGLFPGYQGLDETVGRVMYIGGRRTGQRYPAFPGDPTRAWFRPNVWAVYTVTVRIGSTWRLPHSYRDRFPHLLNDPRWTLGGQVNGIYQPPTNYITAWVHYEDEPAPRRVADIHFPLVNYTDTPFGVFWLVTAAVGRHRTQPTIQVDWSGVPGPAWSYFGGGAILAREAINPFAFGPLAERGGEDPATLPAPVLADAPPVPVPSASPTPSGIHTLTVIIQGTGTGTVRVVGNTGPGALVTLTAMPASGSQFSGWGGSFVVNNTVTMDTPKTVTAVFTALAAVPGPDTTRLEEIPRGAALHLGAFRVTEPADGVYELSGHHSDFSCIAYDPLGARMLLFGGAHGPAHATCPFELRLPAAADVASLRDTSKNPVRAAWNALYVSTRQAEMTRNNYDPDRGAWRSTGHPLCRHTYNGAIVFGGRFWLFVDATSETAYLPQTAPPIKYPLQRERVASMDLATNQWVFHYGPLAGNARWPTGYDCSALVDPASGHIVLIGDGQRKWHLYDPQAHRSIVGPPYPSMPGLNGATSVYCPLDDAIYSFHWYRQAVIRVYRFRLNRQTLAASTIQEIPTTGAVPAIGKSAPRAFIWDTPRQRMVAGPFQRMFWCFDPLTATWSEEPVQSQISPTNIDLGEVLANCIAHDPVHDLYVFLANSAQRQQCWLYRPAQARA